MKPYYQDKWVTIYHGDSLELLWELPTNSVDMVFTDPPYGTKTDTNYSGSGLDWSRSKATGIIQNDNLSNNDLIKFNEQWLSQIKRIIRPTLDIFVCFNWKVWDEFSKSFRTVGLPITSLIVWDRVEIQNAVFKYNPCHEFIAYFGNLATKTRISNRTNVWRFPKERNDLHPTMKPIAMVQEAILDCTNPNDTLLDPFLGSGTSVFAAKKLNRQAIGIEIDEKYCEVSAQRCCQDVMELV